MPNCYNRKHSSQNRTFVVRGSPAVQTSISSLKLKWGTPPCREGGFRLHVVVTHEQHRGDFRVVAEPADHQRVRPVLSLHGAYRETRLRHPSAQQVSRLPARVSPRGILAHALHGHQLPQHTHHGAGIPSRETTSCFHDRSFSRPAAVQVLLVLVLVVVVVIVVLLPKGFKPTPCLRLCT